MCTAAYLQGMMEMLWSRVDTEGVDHFCLSERIEI